MLTKALFDSPKARPLRGRFRLLLHGFQSHYFRPQPLELVGGFAHRGPGGLTVTPVASLRSLSTMSFAFSTIVRLAPVRPFTSDCPKWRYG